MVAITSTISLKEFSILVSPVIPILQQFARLLKGLPNPALDERNSCHPSCTQFIAMSLLRPLVAALGLADSLEVLARGPGGDPEGIGLSHNIRRTLSTPSLTHGVVVVVLTGHGQALGGG